MEDDKLIMEEIVKYLAFQKELDNLEERMKSRFVEIYEVTHGREFSGNITSVVFAQGMVWFEYRDEGFQKKSGITLLYAFGDMDKVKNCILTAKF